MRTILIAVATAVVLAAAGCETVECEETYKGGVAACRFTWTCDDGGEWRAVCDATGCTLQQMKLVEGSHLVSEVNVMRWLAAENHVCYLSGVSAVEHIQSLAGAPDWWAPPVE